MFHPNSQITRTGERRKTKKEKKTKREAAVGLATLAANGEPMDVDDDEEKPPLHVFFDIEAMQGTKTHVVNLVVAETDEDDRPVRFKGETSMTGFLTMVRYSDSRRHSRCDSDCSQFPGV